MQGKKIKTFLKKLLFFFKKAVIFFWKFLIFLKNVLEFCKTAATATTLSIESTMGRTFHRVMAAFFYMVKRVAVTTFTSFLPQKVRRRGKKQEAEDDQILGKGGNTGTQHPETGSAEYCTPTNKTLTTAWWESDCGSPELKFQPYGTGWSWTLWLNMMSVQLI